jgi:hypothetical protein
VPPERAEQFSSRQAEALRDVLRERKAVGLCTPKLAQELCALGIDPDGLYQDEAKQLLQQHKRQRRDGRG